MTDINQFFSNTQLENTTNQLKICFNNCLCYFSWCCLRPKNKKEKKGKKIQIADQKGRNKQSRKCDRKDERDESSRQSSRSKANSSAKSNRSTVGKEEESNISFMSSSIKSKGSVHSKASYASNTSTI